MIMVDDKTPTEIMTQEADAATVEYLTHEIEQLENVSNEYLHNARELVYAILHFIKKSNKSTALAIRNANREVVKSGKEFKDISIPFFQ